jgi:ubiquinone/menaquinone biosynthesis C-methylase UbiE
MDWKKESEKFDLTAEYYDRFRPSYPQAIINTIIGTTGINNCSNLLEIGAGSGKATELFASGGYSIRCIEPGENLVKNGRIKFAEYKNIEFTRARFEELELASEYYDVIFSAQAFHWVPQPVGYEKCAYTLKKTGYLALFWNMYITYDNELDRELVKLSEKYGGFADFLTEQQCKIRINSIKDSIENSGHFNTPDIHRVLWEKDYTADEFYGFVQTGNFFVQKPEEVKLSAYRDIRALADKYGGTIKRPYLCVLYIASKM